MKVEKIGSERIIQSNACDPCFNYFAWPTCARLQDGSLLTVFYSRYPGLCDTSVILGQKWRLLK